VRKGLGGLPTDVKCEHKSGDTVCAERSSLCRSSAVDHPYHTSSTEFLGYWWKGRSGGTLRTIDVSKIFGGIRATLTSRFPCNNKIEQSWRNWVGQVAEKRRHPHLKGLCVNPPGAANRASQALLQRSLSSTALGKRQQKACPSSFTVTRASCTLAVNNFLCQGPPLSPLLLRTISPSPPSPPCQDLRLPS
jgi:hypothetical protein